MTKTGGQSKVRNFETKERGGKSKEKKRKKTREILFGRRESSNSLLNLYFKTYKRRWSDSLMTQFVTLKKGHFENKK